MDLRTLKTLLRERKETGRWYFALSGQTDTQLMATGVFTCDQKHAFFSKRSIASFRGRLFSLRDHNVPGRRLDTVSVLISGQSVPVVLRFDNLEADFREKMIFTKRTVYFVCMSSETQEQPQEMGI